jgi:phosphate acetyltransferase
LKTIVLPESYDKRVVKAARIIVKRKIAKVILIRTNRPLPIQDNENLDIIDIGFSLQFKDDYKKLKSGKENETRKDVPVKELNDPLIFALMLLKNNFADVAIAGSVYSTANVLRNAIKIIGTSEGNKIVSSFFLFRFPPRHRFHGKVFAYADCGVIPAPDYRQLSDIALMTARNYRKLTGRKPRVAFLSFSTKGSASHESVDIVIKAYRLTRKRRPDLICDGELQFDAAFVPDVAKIKNPGGLIKGDANVFIFPDLNSANIAYKITERIGGAFATGPIVQGLAKPVMDLSRGCSADDIVRMAEISIKL